MATTEEKQALLGPASGSSVNQAPPSAPDYEEQPPPYSEEPCKLLAISSLYNSSLL